MTLEELQEAIDKDLKINDTELDLESLKTPQLHNKYLKHLNNYKLLLSRAETEYSTMKREKWEYYTGKADPAVYQLKPFNLKLLKPDADKYIYADDVVIKAQQKVTYLKTTVDYLDRTLRIITNRTFQIKNAIEWRKFMSGAI